MVPTGIKRLEYYEPLIPGDSGSPTFWVIDDQLVLLAVSTYGGTGGGTSVTMHKDLINQWMNELGGGYQLTEIDLSCYPGGGD